MKKYLHWTVIILGVMTVMAFGQQNPEQDFVNRAIMANQYEIAMARQAGQRSSNEAVKTYSQMLVDEHQKMLNELQKYAEAKGWTVSDQLDETYQGQLGNLEGSASERYDQSFKNAAIASHEKSIALYEAAGLDAAITDATLKTWISDKLPSLKSHLGQARDLRLEEGNGVKKLIPPLNDTIKTNKK